MSKEIKTYYSEEFRTEMLELSDRRILQEVNVTDYDLWDIFIQDYLKEFKNRFGASVYLLGRSGRHVCVTDNKINRTRYDSMKKYINNIQNEIVSTWNSAE